VHADLKGAELIEADLSGADLRGAHLDSAVLSGAYLGWANLTEADLAEVQVKALGSYAKPTASGNDHGEPANWENIRLRSRAGRVIALEAERISRHILISGAGSPLQPHHLDGRAQAPG